MNILKELQKPLAAHEIEFRVQSVSPYGKATILAYKDARADMERLDAAVGVLGWKREHVNSNKNCIVSIYDKESEQWVSKEDTGTESNMEKEKGLASDSFKRACFNWGIGRELYDYPTIQIELKGDGKGNPDNKWTDEWIAKSPKTQKPTTLWGLRLKEWIWFNQFDEDGNLNYLAAKDYENKLRFQWGKYIKEQEKAA
jgi:hypothetical protein